MAPNRIATRLAAGAALVLSVLAGLTWIALRPSTSDASEPGAVVYRVPVQGTIELGLAPFISRSIGEAEAAEARAIVLELSTNGGRIDAAQEIIQSVRETDLPVYAYVNRHALSAGAMIALAADRIYMRDGAILGAATPVDGTGEKASEKVVSVMRSQMRTLAQERGLDPRIAEAMVDEDIEIEGVVEAGKLLTLTTDEAVSVGYAQEVQDLDALLAEVGLGSAAIATTEVNWAENVVRFLTHPMVAPLLLTLGFLGILFELKTPSFGLAGTVGVGSLLAFFGSRFLVGLAGWEELLLIVAGVALIAIEILVIPGFGVAGIAGALALGAGIMLSMVGIASTPAEWSQAAGVLSLSLLVGIVIAWALLRKLPKTGRFTTSGLMLGEATDRERGYLSQPARDELVGSLGVALTDLRPAGTGRFGNERVDVVSDASWISAGTPIRIIRAEGYRHVVEPVEAGADTRGTGSAESSMGGSEAPTPPRDARAEARPEPTE